VRLLSLNKITRGWIVRLSTLEVSFVMLSSWLFLRILDVHQTPLSINFDEVLNSSEPQFFSSVKWE
jgi:hypothetical protein